MRSLAFMAAAGLMLAPFVAAQAGEPAKKAATKAKAEAKAETCSGDHGTSIEFEDSPKEAAARAKKEQKLVLVLHVSGHFEDPKLT